MTVILVGVSISHTFPTVLADIFELFDCKGLLTDEILGSFTGRGENEATITRNEQDGNMSFRICCRSGVVVYGDTFS